MLWRGENVADRSLLDDLARVHDAHAVGHPLHHADVVGNQDDGHVQLFGDLGQEVEKVGLHLGIERAGGLVRDQQLGPAKQRHRDHHSLAFAAAQLMRVRSRNPIDLGNVGGGQMLPCRLVRFASAETHLHGRGLRHLVADPEIGIEGRPRVLEDHGHLGPAHPFHRLVVEIEQVDAVQRDFARDDPPRRRDQPEDREAGGGLARAGLAHQANGLPARDIEIDAVDRPHRVRRQLEMSREPAHAQHRLGGGAPRPIAVCGRAHGSRVGDRALCRLGRPTTIR